MWVRKTKHEMPCIFWLSLHIWATSSPVESLVMYCLYSFRKFTKYSTEWTCSEISKVAASSFVPPALLLLFAVWQFTTDETRRPAFLTQTRVHCCYVTFILLKTCIPYKKGSHLFRLSSLTKIYFDIGDIYENIFLLPGNVSFEENRWMIWKKNKVARCLIKELWIINFRMDKYAL